MSYKPPYWRPIIVPAYTRNPDEECYCPKCEDEVRLVRKGNKLVCPNGCDADVLILPPIDSDTKRST